jgi:hypothetical protein
MRKTLPSLILLALHFIFIAGYGQSPGIEWQKTFTGWFPFGSVGKAIHTADGNVLVTSTVATGPTFPGSHGALDTWVTKVNKDGVTLWSRALGGSDQDWFTAAYEMADGGFIIIGRTTSTNGDVTGKLGYDDIWVVKLSANGTLLWQKTVGGSAPYIENDIFVKGLGLPDNSFILIGHARSTDEEFATNHGSWDMFAMKFSTTGSIAWTRCIGGTSSEFAADALIKPNGNILLAGRSQSANGDFTTNKGADDLALVELDGSGNLLWTKTYGGAAAEQVGGLIRMETGRYAVLAQTASNSGDITGAHGDQDLWIVSFNETGNLLWQKSLGGSKSERSSGMNYSSFDGSLVISAVTYSNDGDVSGFHGGYDSWLVKLSNTGQLLWQKALGGSGNENPSQLLIDQSGQLIFTAQTNSSDGDVSGFHGVSDAWVVNLSSSGNLVWQKSLGGSGTELPTRIYADGNGYTLLALTQSNNDGDVRGNHYKSDTLVGDTSTTIYFYSDIWIVHVGNNGTLEWQKCLGGSGEDTPGELFFMDGKRLLVASSGSSDGDAAPANGKGQGLWFVKLGLSNIIKGNVFLDLNANGIRDANEPGYDKVSVKSGKTNYNRVSIPYNGAFKNEVDTGTYTTIVTVANPYFAVHTAPKQSVFNTWFNTDSANFAVRPIPGIRDLTVNLASLSPVRPGFNTAFRIYYKNSGTDTVATGYVYMLKDNRTTMSSATPMPDRVSGDSLFWNFTNLNPFQEVAIDLSLSVGAPPLVNITDTLRFKAFIEPVAQDQQLADNQDSVIRVATGSYDPNDKNENHGGHVTLSEASNGYLSYVIRFQNLGTDTAFSIIVRDTLDEKLDWSSIEMIGASHAYSLQIADGNKCTWRFDNILLPHSAINEPASHGFITYRLKTRNVQVNDVIKNSASIYFDFNLPVKTQTHETGIQADPIGAPPKPVLSGLLASYCSNQGTVKVKLTNLPAAPTTVTVTVNGAALSVLADSTVSISLSTAGTKNMVVTYTNTIGTQSTNASFTVLAAVTPDVNVSAGSLQVVSNPVTITAVNASGGGKDPRYIFAWDNNFTNLLQAESAQNTVTVQATSFVTGDNKVYVKMRTSETCYTSQTAIDSITIHKEQPTGIVDADNPGQIITVYPNPFTALINIKGLSTAKKYRIDISNLSGQVLYSKRIVNRADVAFTDVQVASGVYYLNIYDEGKKKLLGSIKILK